MSDEGTTVSVRVKGEGEWRDLTKDGVRDEWTDRGLGGQEEAVAHATIETELRSISRRLTLDWLGRYLPSPTCKALEIGCGWGRIMLGMKERHPGLDYTGIDLTENLIELGKRLAAERGVAEPLRLAVDDAEDLSLADDNFDFAYSCRVFQYLPRPEIGARNAFRVLRPGGRLVLVLPNKQNPKRRRYHTTLHGPDVVERWLDDAGFRDIRVDYFGFMPVAHQEPMGLLDRAVEIGSHLPGLRRIGALMLVTGVKPT